MDRSYCCFIKLQDDVAAGKDIRLNLDNVKRTIEDLTARLEVRRKELEGMRHVISATPVVLGGALVIPAGLLAQRKGSGDFSADAEARKKIEMIAMNAVINKEQGSGYIVTDVSGEKCGWDITSRPRSGMNDLDSIRHIEVKGRAKGQDCITVSRNEILYGLNQSDKFILAIVIVDEDRYEGPFYIRRPFNQEPDWAVTSMNYDLTQLMSKVEVIK